MRTPVTMLRALLVVLAALALLPAAARAEDEPGSWRLRAVDYTARFQSDDPKSEHLLRGVAVTVLATGEGAPAPFDVVTGDDGTFVVPPAVAKSKSVQFLVPSPDGSRWPRYMTQALEPAAEPRPEVAGFLRIAASSPLFAEQVMQPYVSMDRTSSRPYARLRWIAMVQNQTPEVWLGDVRSRERGSIQAPLPDGFEVLNVVLSGTNPPFEVGDAPGGGREIRIASPVFPSFRGPDRLEITMTGAWRKGGEWDLSFTAPFDIGSYTLMAEEGAFTVAPGGDLAGGERQPPVEGRLPATLQWTASEIPAGRTLAIRVLQGHRIDWRVWTMLGILAMALTGGALIGKAVAAGRGPAAAAPSDEASGEDVVADAIADLERRRKRGEITEFEAKARQAALARAAAARTTERDELAAIEARLATATAEQLRKDARRLVELAREARRT